MLLVATWRGSSLFTTKRIPEVVTFEVTPQFIHSGDTVNVTWETRHGHETFLNDVLVSASGTSPFRPKTTQRYTLRVKNRAGEVVEDSLRLMVHHDEERLTSNTREVLQRDAKPQVSRQATPQKPKHPQSPKIIMAAPRLNLGIDGVWKGKDGSVYYLRQMEDQFWGVGFSSDSGQTFTSLINGKIHDEELMQGKLVGMPMGTSRDTREIEWQIDMDTQIIQEVNAKGSESTLYLTFIDKHIHVPVSMHGHSQGTLKLDVFDLTGEYVTQMPHIIFGRVHPHPK